MTNVIVSDTGMRIIEKWLPENYELGVEYPIALDDLIGYIRLSPKTPYIRPRAYLLSRKGTYLLRYRVKRDGDLHYEGEVEALHSEQRRREWFGKWKLACEKYGLTYTEESNE